jgi:hypothetical protein
LWGNLRTAFTDSFSLPVSGVYAAPIITQINDYDLLGFEHFNNQPGKNNKLFQNQERVFDLDLGIDFFKYRVSDPVSGRFWSPDPLSSKYPYNSVYAFQENKFGKGVELEGLELENFFSQFKNPNDLKVKTPDPDKSQIQVYSTTINDSKKSFEEMKETFLKTPEKLLSNSKAEFHAPENAQGEQTGLQKGNTIEIEIAGPQNDSYVKVHKVISDKNKVSATFVTLEGHVERGVINFSIRNDGNNGMTFTIGSMSQLDIGVANSINKLGDFSRKSQKESWKEVLNNFNKITGGTETKRIIK